MPRNIVICCDGTGNEFGSKSATSHDGKKQYINDNSNVVRLYTCLEVNKDQVAYYHPGVGTMASPAARSKIERWWSKVMGLAFGIGFTGNLADAYKFLMDHYTEGDRIFLFGFSRGAYTVRALAGALNLYGLLCSGNEGHLPYLLRMYSQASHDAFNREKGEPRRLSETKESKAFRETFSRPVSIHFMGVWDTVSSVGWITDPIKLLYDGRNPIIRKGRHAISICEKRCFFQAMPWGPPMDINEPKLDPDDLPKLKLALKDDPGWTKQDIVQAWFPGVHSDVGGSYPLPEASPALTAFEWMLKEAREVKIGGQVVQDGVLINEEKRAALKGIPSHGNSAIAEWNADQPLPGVRLHQSFRGAWPLLELFPHKYFDYEGTRHWQFEPWPHLREIPDHAIIHPNARNPCSPCLQGQQKNFVQSRIADFTPTDRPDLYPEARQRLIDAGFGIYNAPKPKQSPLPAAIATACICLGAAAFLLGRHR